MISTLLALDTSGPAASAALMRGGSLLACAMVENNRTHSEKILSLCDFVLQSGDVAREELEGIAVANGPGSFTGLRIGVCLAKAMAQALNLPCLGVNTLLALCAMAPGTGLRAAIMDARRGEVYACLMRGDEVLMAPCALPLEQVMARVAAYEQPCAFFGDGVRAYRERILERLPTAQLPSDAQCVQRADTVALLAAKMPRERWQNALTLDAEYLRPSSAQTLAQRQRDE